MAEQMFKASSVDLNFYHNDVKSEKTKSTFASTYGMGTKNATTKIIRNLK